MRATGMPNGIGGVGFSALDIPALQASTLPQRRLLSNAPKVVDAGRLEALFANALRYW